MITKFFAAKADGVDNTSENISVLLNADNELFVGSDEDALREYFGADAYAGKVAYKDRTTASKYMPLFRHDLSLVLMYIL